MRAWRREMTSKNDNAKWHHRWKMTSLTSRNDVQKWHQEMTSTAEKWHHWRREITSTAEKWHHWRQEMTTTAEKWHHWRRDLASTTEKWHHWRRKMTSTAENEKIRWCKVVISAHAHRRWRWKKLKSAEMKCWNWSSRGEIGKTRDLGAYCNSPSIFRRVARYPMKTKG